LVTVEDFSIKLIANANTADLALTSWNWSFKGSSLMIVSCE